MLLHSEQIGPVPDESMAVPLSLKGTCVCASMMHGERFTVMRCLLICAPTQGNLLLLCGV